MTTEGNRGQSLLIRSHLCLEVAYEIADGDKFKENVNVSTVKAIRDALQATSELKGKVVEKFSFKDPEGYWKEVGDEQSAPLRYQGKVYVRVNLQKGKMLYCLTRVHDVVPILAYLGHCHTQSVLLSTTNSESPHSEAQAMR